MSAPGVTAQQYAPRDNGVSYSSKSNEQPNGQKTRRTQAQNQQVHSGRLIYADPRSLPSYPTIGLKDENASSAAANASAAALYHRKNSEKKQHVVSQQAQTMSAAITRSTTTAAYKAATQTKSPPPIYDTSGPINPNSLKAASHAASAALYSPAASAPTDRVTSPSPNPIVMERPSTPLDSSAIGSTAGSSMTAATLAAGSAASRRRHHRQPSRDSTPASTGGSSPSKPSAWGNTAANQAFKYSQDAAAASKASMASERPIPEIAALGPQPSLRAAKGAMHAASTAGSPGRATPVRTMREPVRTMRERSVSNPTVFRHQKSLSSHYPDTGVTSPTPPAATTTNASALSAAAFATRPRSSQMPEGGAVPYTTLNRQKFTSHPVLTSDVEEKKHEDGLHASAVAMAKRMYNPKTGVGMGEVHTDSLQEAAYKLAQERLEKLHLEHEKGRGFRDHYMDPRMTAPASAEADASRRFSIRGKLRRRRSSSDSEVVEDRRRSLEVRSMVGSMSATDYERRRQDRQSVLVAAQRNVQARLQSIDEQVYNDTGRVHPSLRSSWDNKAQAAAQARSASRQRNGPGAGQIDLGFGKYMDSSEVDRIASERVQPILDEINEKAEIERERQAALKKEEEDRKTEAMLLKAHNREMKDAYRKMKQEEKAAKKKEKAAAKEAKASEANGAVVADDTNSETMTAPDLTEPEAEDSGAATSPSVESSGEQQQSPRRSLKVLTFKNTSPKKAKATTSDGSGNRLSKLFALPPKLNIANVHKNDELQSPQTSRGETVGPPGPADVPGASTVPVAEDATGASGAIVAASAAAEATGESSSSQAPAQAPTSTKRSTVTKAPTDRTAVPKSPRSPVSPNSENDSSAPSPSKKVKTWLKSRFNRPRSKSTTSASSPTSAATAETSGGAALSPDQAHGDKSFVGGHALTTDSAGAKNDSTAESAAGGTSGTTFAAVGGAAAMGAGALTLAAAEGSTSAQPETPRSAVQDGQTTSATEATEATETPGATETEATTADSAPDTSRFADELSAIPTHETSTAQVNGSTQINETSTVEANKLSTEQVITTGPVAERAPSPPLGGKVVRVGPDNFTYPSATSGSSTSIGGATGTTAAATGALPTAAADEEVDSKTATTPGSNTDGKADGFVSVPLVMSEPESKTATPEETAETDPSLSPPRTLRDPADRKTPSPVRDSRFMENLEGFI